MNISVNGPIASPPWLSISSDRGGALALLLEEEESCKIGTTPQNDWYFFSHKDKKYPTGTRTNRATAAGFWKATGRDKVIHSSFKRIGMRKTLVFYKGRAPHGQKSDWIMHEYRLDDNSTSETNVVSNAMGEATQEEGWVVCRIFKKKNFHKTLDSPTGSSITIAERRTTQMLNSNGEGALEQILEYMGKRTSCKEETEADDSRRFVRPIDTVMINSGLHDRFMKLPNLESPNSSSSQQCYQLPVHGQMLIDNNELAPPNTNQVMSGSETGRPNDWITLDRLVASHLNGQTDTSKQLACFNNEPTMAFTSPTDHDLQLPQLRSSSNRSSYHATLDYSSEIDLWSFTRSALLSSELPYHMSNAPV
ncbi:hypothetical protein L1049_014132 [Liquidambar formosana]|uniref:NAC domain-containing protein n=1 Tax=Liquidambar formosana TaxID=63359 RepID=A0AAP0RPZ2_LIQFO